MHMPNDEADLSLFQAHMSEGTFSHVMAHLCILYLYLYLPMFEFQEHKHIKTKQFIRQ